MTHQLFLHYNYCTGAQQDQNFAWADFCDVLAWWKRQERPHAASRFAITVAFPQAQHSLFKNPQATRKAEGLELFHFIQNSIKKSDVTGLWSLSPPSTRQKGVSHEDAVKQHSWTTILCISKLVLVISPSGHFCSQAFLHSLFIFKVSATHKKKKKKENLIAIPSFPCIIIFSSELINSQSDPDPQLPLGLKWCKRFLSALPQFYFCPNMHQVQVEDYVLQLWT